jgi:hypothetical protein
MEMFDALRRVGSRWTVVSPQLLPDGRFELYGSAEKPQARVFALDSLDFVVTGA